MRNCLKGGQTLLRSLGPPARPRTAFTLVELLVGSVVVVIALTGIFALMKHATDAERRTALRWDDRAAAEAVASHLVIALERAVYPPGGGIAAGPQEDGSMLLTFYTEPLTAQPTQDAPALPDGTPPQRPDPTALAARTGIGVAGGRPPLQRRRYHWNFAEAERRGALELRTLLYAGATLLTPGMSEVDPGDPQIWERLTASTVARGVQGISVEYRPAKDPDAEWMNRWHGPPEGVTVRVRVRVGDESVERIVTPHVGGTLLSSEEG